MAGVGRGGSTSQRCLQKYHGNAITTTTRRMRLRKLLVLCRNSMSYHAYRYAIGMLPQLARFPNYFFNLSILARNLSYFFRAQSTRSCRLLIELWSSAACTPMERTVSPDSATAGFSVFGSIWRQVSVLACFTFTSTHKMT